MSKQLDVYLHDSLAGQLEQDKHGRISFAYDPSWLNQPNSVPLSHSLPLRAERYQGKECQGFFAGVLPEEQNREIIASILGISARNDFALLEQIGGECAGAVTFIPAGLTLPVSKPEYRLLGEAELAEILRELPHRPLMAGSKDIRLSLAGAQNKLAVYVENGKISLPLHNAPSTHILKPASLGGARFEGLVQNEAFCMELAAMAGLPTAKVSIGQCEDIEYLLAERYDRHTDQGGQLIRLHQEDCCQALGLPPHMKYQNEGGPSLAQCFDLVREVSSTPAPDILNLLDAVTFNFLIGNNDAHGKNFSFLYESKSGRHTARLAPLYDLVSTSHYPELSPNMAMKIGSRYASHQLRLRHWQTLWQAAKVSENAAQKRTLRFAEKLSKLLAAQVVDDPIQQEISKATVAKARRLVSSLS
ncbi:type II toxin-antitoxin system HipA family toxin [Verrucomicrobiaceae bacterium N1E253]|uniref:Type II toxin-antitoxin system HipA family toxin n=1 Tax=Oceaniferula marina TaxID=2748318 RepID=A0A851GN73_9BACT|nr:type II toxin-antitoxin system HipA family toxin [Oceaniferula marina]NWK57281.1 type II toxin-antitoxin system HipA family toxin [Oceaniferula marina]